MPYYSFITSFEDEPTSAEFTDDDTAWEHAISLCGQILRNLKGSVAGNLEWQMEVTKEEATPLGTIRLYATRQAGV